MWVMSIIKKGEKFYYQFMAYGIRKHGLCRGCKTETEAKAYEGKKRQEIDDLHNNKIGKEQVITCKQLFKDYELYSKANNKDYYNDKSRLRIIKTYFDDEMVISDVTPAFLDGFKSRVMADRKISGATYNRYFAIISKAFNLAIINYRLKINNPCIFANKCKEDNHIIRYLTEEEEERLFKELNKDIMPIIVCALTTGLRRSNVLNLKWEQINFDMGFIEVLKQDNKGHKKIQIPLSKKLRDVLEEIGVKKSGYVFVNPQTGKPYNNVTKGFKKACERAKINNFRFHDLRHTVATRLVANGIDLNTLKQFMAHSNIRTTERYMHPTPENMKKAVDILDSFI